MFSRIERAAAMKGFEPPVERGAANKRRVARGWGWPAVFASFVATSGCSDGRVEIATITIEAGAPDVAKCEYSDFRDATDMGLDLYFVLERSWENQSEWGPVASALTALFNSNASEWAGIGAGFAVYPKRMPPPQSCIDNCGTSDCDCLDECGCWHADENNQGICFCTQWRTSCNEKDYVPSFEISRVNEIPDGFNSALLRVSWDQDLDEPAMYPALLASFRYRDAWEGEASNRGRRIIQVLVATSLDFANHLECDSDDEVSDVERVLSGGNKPKTYVVAVNPSTNDEDEWAALAAAGRTDQATTINFRTRPPIPPPPTKEFTDLIRKIRDADGRCEYLVPALGPDLDAKKVNLTASSSGVLYPKVANRAACAGNSQGWYYDADDNPNMNPALPKRIMACDGACRSLHGQDVASGSATARIQLGCPTVTTVTAGDAGTPSPR